MDGHRAADNFPPGDGREGDTRVGRMQNNAPNVANKLSEKWL
ncbi:hypothetical protein POX_h09411 [Penicillium oxalicum]|uniref:Uncharacterized protein n=1 Tax=Penicillium oxalicum (strain 114-2 / CGMCC 5302) TaxID=933388 RepID=S7ZR16_PENO1|nr:hypothetical protein POX_h09411 [Penicillium oxalicum]EPS31111.1 hypothetical protein PDE_06066 [Penicillium oxalicum 114-2]KAI2785653.1 hypothetical protein POX_h09411 [Penicillium oxalicum]